MTDKPMTMVERVARFIGENYDGYADPIATPNNWARAKEAARAAIEAMRDPTWTVLNAAYPVADNHRANARQYWNDAIDAALKEQKMATVKHVGDGSGWGAGHRGQQQVRSEHERSLPDYVLNEIDMARSGHDIYGNPISRDKALSILAAYGVE